MINSSSESVGSLRGAWAGGAEANTCALATSWTSGVSIGVVDHAGSFFVAGSISGTERTSMFAVLYRFRYFNCSCNLKVLADCSRSDRWRTTFTACTGRRSDSLSLDNVRDGLDRLSLADGSSMSPAAIGSRLEKCSIEINGTGWDFAWAYISLSSFTVLGGFSESLCFNLTESVFDTWIADNASSKSEENEGLFHFERFNDLFFPLLFIGRVLLNLVTNSRSLAENLQCSDIINYFLYFRISLALIKVR